MRCLELFSGTGSVGKVLKELGHSVISLDLKGADINCNILDWDYTIYEPNYFEYIHASPPCDTFSVCRKSWIGRTLKAHGDNIITPEILLKDQIEIGLPILKKTREILDYSKPKYFTLENPQSGDMKNYITDLEFTDVDYCKYGFPYRKRTRIWNNFGFRGIACNKDCNFMNGNRHSMSIGHSKDYGAQHFSLREKYRIPPKLIRDWINFIVEL